MLTRRAFIKFLAAILPASMLAPTKCASDELIPYPQTIILDQRRKTYNGGYVFSKMDFDRYTHVMDSYRYMIGPEREKDYNFRKGDWWGDRIDDQLYDLIKKECD
jgi:hypothetical protein